MDQLTRSHPNAGILLLGDFNQLPEARLESCPLEQVVTTTTCGNTGQNFLLQCRVRHPSPYQQSLLLTMKLSYFDLRRILLDQLNWSAYHITR